MRAAAPLLAAALMLLGCGGGAVAFAASAGAATPAPKAGLRGLVPEPLPRKPRFVLTDTAGTPFNFAAATRGKLTYLYFGYTHCPDACPTTMAYLAAAYHSQPAAVRNRIAVVFVTVDPRRDTRRVLRVWLDHFDSHFVGLTGSPRQIDLAEQAAGVPPAPAVNGKSAIAHSSYLFPYSPDGTAHVVYISGFHPADYSHDMPLLLRYS